MDTGEAVGVGKLLWTAVTGDVVPAVLDQLDLETLLVWLLFERKWNLPRR